MKFEKQPMIFENLANNLRTLMHFQSISEAELARKTFIPQPTLHKILAKKTIDPRISTLKILADFFKISLNELLVGIASKKDSNNKHSIPLLSWTDCLNPELNKADAYCALTNAEDEGSYALTSKPTMEPRFLRGTVLIVNSKKQPADGDYIIAHYLGSDEAALRIFCNDGPQKWLLPANKDSEKTILNEQIKILGVITKSIYIHKN